MLTKLRVPVGQLTFQQDFLSSFRKIESKSETAKKQSTSSNKKCSNSNISKTWNRKLNVVKFKLAVATVVKRSVRTISSRIA